MVKKYAFTLAEVLITLGIIGIVAALTIPQIITKHNKIVVETSLKKFYSNMNEAIRFSEIDNGDKKKWDYCLNYGTSGEYSESCLRGFYDKYYAKYLKTLKNISYSAEKRKLEIYFADGSVAEMSYRGMDYIYCTSGKYIDKEYDNNVYGKYCFMFAMYPNGASGLRSNHFLGKGLEPYITDYWDGTPEGLYTAKANYAKIIQLNNWKIPDDYPLKF